MSMIFEATFVKTTAGLQFFLEIDDWTTPGGWGG